MIAELRVTLDGGAVGQRITATVCCTGLRVFRLLCGVIVIAQEPLRLWAASIFQLPFASMF